MTLDSSASNEASATHLGDTPLGDGVREQLADLIKSELATAVTQLKSETSAIVNRAVTQRLDRFEQTQAAKAAEQPTQTDEGTKELQQGAPKSTDDRLMAAELKKLRDQLNEEKEARTAAERAREEETADRELREMIEAAGIADTASAFRVLKPDLKRENGKWLHETEDGGIVTASEFVAERKKATPWMQPPTGKQGDGGPEKSAGSPGGGGNLSFDDMLKAPPGALLGMARDADNKK